MSFVINGNVAVVICIAARYIAETLNFKLKNFNRFNNFNTFFVAIKSNKILKLKKKYFPPVFALFLFPFPRLAGI